MCFFFNADELIIYAKIVIIWAEMLFYTYYIVVIQRSDANIDICNINIFDTKICCLYTYM